MKLEQKLEQILQPTIESMGFELWGLEYVPVGKHSTLRVYIDKPEGVTVDDCADVSYQISSVMDVEDPITAAYHLEVSSPGMDRQLFKPSHFAAYQGKTIQVRTALDVMGRKRFKGPMVSVRDDEIEIEVDGEIYPIPMDLIAKANVVPEFK